MAQGLKIEKLQRLVVYANITHGIFLSFVRPSVRSIEIEIENLLFSRSVGACFCLEVSLGIQEGLLELLRFKSVR